MIHDILNTPLAEAAGTIRGEDRRWDSGTYP